MFLWLGHVLNTLSGGNVRILAYSDKGDSAQAAFGGDGFVGLGGVMRGFDYFDI